MNAVLIAGVTPVVEELMFRGAGYSLLARFGQVVAILVVGVTFGLVHGLVYGLAALTAFGIGLAWLRAKTESIYPCIVVHCLFNAAALSSPCGMSALYDSRIAPSLSPASRWLRRRPRPAGRANVALTLNAPGATTFGHVVDFAGRLSPNAPGTRVSLMRGKTVVAAMALKRDGSYRFQVELARPGPFHTVAAGVSSKPVVVRIVPELRAKLVGSRVVGTPLTLVARLYPAEAGDVRVRVVRDGSYAYRGAFADQARVRLGTASPAPFAVAVDVLPAKGYGYVGERIRVALRAPTIAYGYRGPVRLRSARAAARPRLCRAVSTGRVRL